MRSDSAAAPSIESLRGGKMPPDHFDTLRQHARMSTGSSRRTRAPVSTADIPCQNSRVREHRASRARVLIAVWCCSVGTTWTVELREPGPGATLGRLVDWISSGVPTFQPAPDETMARTLLADRGLHLYPDSTLGPGTSTRRSIGYVSKDTKVITRAHQVRAAAAAAGAHPVMLAPQPITAGYDLHPDRAEP